jgi:hypothetical protein
MSHDWNLDQALGWVVWRNQRVVDLLENDSFSAMTMWMNTTHNLWGFDSPLPMISDRAALLHALRKGTVNARGRRNGKGDREHISAQQWRDLQFHSLSRMQAIPDFKGIGSWWTELKLNPDEVKKVFSSKNAGSDHSTRRKKNRPNHTDALKIEYQRRVEKKELLGDWRKECDDLFLFHKKNVPLGIKPMGKVKTIQMKVVQQKQYNNDYEEQQATCATN